MTTPQLALVPPVDTLTFSLNEERVVHNDTVRIVVRIFAQKNAGATEEALRSEIKQALLAFVDAPDWELSPARRETQPTGVETVSMTANVRVPETENHDLKARAEKVSSPGLALSGPVADLTIPNDLLQAAESDLRRMLLGRALTEAASLSEPYGKLVVHAVAFGAITSAREPVPPGLVVRSAVPKTPAGPGGGAAEEDMAANAARMSMSATITLRRVVDPPAR